MLDIALWKSFEFNLSEKDISVIHSRLLFLQDILTEALRHYEVVDVRSDLDLNLLIYFRHFDLAKHEEISPWLIHDCWFLNHKEGEGLNSELKCIFKKYYSKKEIDLRSEIEIFLLCLKCDNLIYSEADAVIWLSFLDYLAYKMLYRIAVERMQPIFGFD
jgi:hypothetical protein